MASLTRLYAPAYSTIVRDHSTKGAQARALPHYSHASANRDTVRPLASPAPHGHGNTNVVLQAHMPDAAHLAQLRPSTAPPATASRQPPPAITSRQAPPTIASHRRCTAPLCRADRRWPALWCCWPCRARLRVHCRVGGVAHVRGDSSGRLRGCLAQLRERRAEALLLQQGPGLGCCRMCTSPVAADRRKPESAA